jgi:hypothetical protein
MNVFQSLALPPILLLRIHPSNPRAEPNGQNELFPVSGQTDHVELPFAE